MKFIQADAYTRECFNPSGLMSYEAILTCRTNITEGYAPYDLTRLEGCPSSIHGLHYLAAHGSVVQKLVFKTKNAAKIWLQKWYLDNRQKMAA